MAMMAGDNSHIAIGKLFESIRLKIGLDAGSQEHLGRCGHCSGHLKWIQAATELGALEAAQDLPESAIERVIRMGRSPSILKKMGNWVIASLTFDSFRELATMGVRGGDKTSRQMTYQADDFEIALWLRRSESHTLTLTGQVTNTNAAPADESAFVDLVISGDHVQRSPLTSWGEFSFLDLPPSQYAVHISLLDRVLRIPILPMMDDEGST